MNYFVVKSWRGSLKKRAKVSIILPKVTKDVGIEAKTKGEIGRMSRC